LCPPADFPGCALGAICPHDAKARYTASA